MKLSEALADVDVLAMDTSLFIYYLEQHPDYFNRVKAIFALVATDKLSIVASTLTLTEFLVKPIQMKNQRWQRQYQKFLETTHNITLTKVDSQIAKKAAELRATYNLKTPDALHVASALITGADAFLTNDKGIQRVNDG